MLERMDCWDWLKTFAAVVRAGTFTGAARALAVSQSTISRHVGELEHAAGVALFARRGTRATLTDAGRALAVHADPVAVAMADFEHALKGLDPRVAGRVRLATVPELASELLAPRVGELLAAHHALRLDLLGRTTLDRLTSGEIDVALRPVAPAAADLVRRRVGTLRYYLYGTRRVAAHDAPPLVGYTDELAGVPEARLVARWEACGRSVVLRVNSTAAAASACAAGAGMAVLPAALARLHPALVRDQRVLLERALYAVTHRELARVPRVRVVLDWLARVVTALDDAPTDRPRRP